jgi:drug/metabolite transporter (DMT)-like permease
MSSQRWLVRFVAVGVSWGSSFLLIKWGLESLTPVGVAFGRQFIGALTLLGIAAVTRMPLPRRREQLRHVAVVAFLLNAFPSFLFAQAEQHVSSVMAGMLNATTPLMAVLVIAFAFREQRITRDQLIGVVVGFVGIVLVTGVLDGAGTNNWHGIAMLLLATVCYGISYPYAQRHLTGMGFTPISISAAQVSAAAVMLLPFAILDGSVLAPPTVHAVVGMLTLGAVGTGLAYVWNFQIVQIAGSAVASTVTYLTPLVATALGIGLLGERVGFPQFVGGILVLVSAALVQQRLRLSH